MIRKMFLFTLFFVFLPIQSQAFEVGLFTAHGLTNAELPVPGNERYSVDASLVTSGVRLGFTENVSFSIEQADVSASERYKVGERPTNWLDDLFGLDGSIYGNTSKTIETKFVNVHYRHFLAKKFSVFASTGIGKWTSQLVIDSPNSDDYSETKFGRAYKYYIGASLKLASWLDVSTGKTDLVISGDHYKSNFVVFEVSKDFSG